MNTLPKTTVLELQLHEPGILVMAFNRPTRLNSMTPQMYLEWKQVMEYVHANQESVRILIITGNGRAYSAGQDLSTVPQLDTPEQIEQLRERNNVARQLSRLLITSPVPLLAAVNGPAIGYTCTTLALCDCVVSLDSAIFRTPFAELAFCAEGCSSVTFPRILGSAVANDMVLFGRTLGAKEMHQRGFISRLVSKQEELLPLALKMATKLAGQPQTAIRASRGLVRTEMWMDELTKANDREMDELFRRMQSEDAKQAIAKMFAKLSPNAKM